MCGSEQELYTLVHTNPNEWKVINRQIEPMLLQGILAEVPSAECVSFELKNAILFGGCCTVLKEA
jgi:hypothetical protein